MASDAFDRDSWERRWSAALAAHPDLATKPPNAQFVAAIGELPSGTALDAGCGHGAEAIWLATSGWRVTAVDFSATALDHARTTAISLGAEVTSRIDWIEGDLATWAPPARQFDLVSSLYMHIAGSVEGTVRRLASGVAPGGTLLLVGHQPVDPDTGGLTPAAGQTQVNVAAAIAALDSPEWTILVAEERRRAQAGTGVDAVIRATYDAA